jgi:hypothetical protein
MSGAQLQTAGQIRNSFPYIARRAVNANLTLITAAPAINAYSRVTIPEALDLPFNYGMDKGGRVYTVINGFSVILSAVGYAAAGIIAGSLYFQDILGIEYLMLSLGDTLPNAKAYNSNIMLSTYTPIFTNNPENIGSLVWRNTASVLSTLTNVTANCVFNIGYYSDYAEFDFTELNKCEHHHHYYGSKDTEIDQTKV